MGAGLGQEMEGQGQQMMGREIVAYLFPGYSLTKPKNIGQIIKMIVSGMQLFYKNCGRSGFEIFYSKISVIWQLFS